MLKTASKLKTGGQIMMIPHENIYPNPNQPRVHFDYGELESLASSIRLNGMLLPITVRPATDGNFELISGERRLRAARIIGMTRVPSIIMDATDAQSALFAVIENIQRQDLDFFEEAVAIEKLLSEHNMSQEAVAKSLGKAQSTLSNKLRLLQLTENIRNKISEAKLTERHARALLKLPDNASRQRALSIIVDKRLTVSETDRLIAQMLKKNDEHKGPSVKSYRDLRIFINTLNHAVDAIRRAGIEADTAKSETDEYIEYVVRIPKSVTPVYSQAI
ncbi:MAG: Nucleoid occlusion protein [Firmicutes bacterium ADurb.Bin300]|nr:MAG: Nucleoid occlusion protein [Firmicutes bacterium ADurb.Bin300]